MRQNAPIAVFAMKFALEKDILYANWPRYPVMTRQKCTRLMVLCGIFGSDILLTLN